MLTLYIHILLKKDGGSLNTDHTCISYPLWSGTLTQVTFSQEKYGRFASYSTMRCRFFYLRKGKPRRNKTVDYERKTCFCAY